MDISNLQNIFPILLKISFLVLDLTLIVFLIVVFKQFSNMDLIVKDLQDSPILKSTLYVILGVAVSLFLTALVIL